MWQLHHPRYGDAFGSMILFPWSKIFIKLPKQSKPRRIIILRRELKIKKIPSWISSPELSRLTGGLSFSVSELAFYISFIHAYKTLFSGEEELIRNKTRARRRRRAAAAPMRARRRRWLLWAFYRSQTHNTSRRGNSFESSPPLPPLKRLIASHKTARLGESRFIRRTSQAFLALFPPPFTGVIRTRLDDIKKLARSCGWWWEA